MAPKGPLEKPLCTKINRTWLSSGLRQVDGGIVAETGKALDESLAWGES